MSATRDSLRHGLRAFGLFAACLLFGHASTRVVADSYTVEDIARAWMARQNATQTLEIVWREDRILAKGSLNGPVRPGMNKSDDVPPKDIAFTVPRVLCRLGANGRVLRETYVEAKETIATGFPSAGVPFVSAFNGDEAKSFSEQGYPRGVIFGGQYPDWRVLPMRPLALMYRPFAPQGLGLNVAAASLGSEYAVVSGVKCAVLDGRDGESVTWRFYVDPQREFIPLRYEEYVERRLSCLIEMSFQSTEGKRVLPSGWNASFVNSDGTVIRSYIASVESATLNEPIRDDQFEVTYPIGTWVIDRRSGGQWIVWPAGARRLITESELERGPSYAELISTKSGEAGLDKSSRLHGRLLVTITVGCTAVALLLYFYLRRTGVT